VTDEKDLDPADWFAAQLGQQPESGVQDEPEPPDAPVAPPAAPSAPHGAPPPELAGPFAPGPVSHVPLVPASPLTPTPAPSDQPAAFNWGLTPGAGRDDEPAPAATPPPDPGGASPAGSADEPAPAAPLPPLIPAEPAIVPWTPPAAAAAPPPFAAEPAIVPWTPPPANAAPPLVEPSASAPVDYGPPTAAFTPEAESWQTPSFDPSLEGATTALAPEPVGTDLPVDESLESSALDSLFGEAQFREYAEEPLLVPRGGAAPYSADGFASAAGTLVAQPIALPAGGGRPPRGPIPRTQFVLLWVAGGLVAAIALVGLFVLGTRIAATLGPSPAVVASPGPDATAPALPATGPLPPGEHAWDALRGGECVEPFESAWQDAYTVVDCTSPHAAQLVTRATFPESDGAPYSSQEELEARTPDLCTAPTVIDYAAVGGITDLQVLSAFAADQAEWDDGHRDYFCFATRSSGEKLTTSIAVANGP
jgi:hypothetical protein